MAEMDEETLAALGVVGSAGFKCFRCGDPNHGIRNCPVPARPGPPPGSMSARGYYFQGSRRGTGRGPSRGQRGTRGGATRGRDRSGRFTRATPRVTFGEVSEDGLEDEAEIGQMEDNDNTGDDNIVDHNVGNEDGGE